MHLSERASVQEHFLDLCALLGRPSPATACHPVLVTVVQTGGVNLAIWWTPR